MNAISELDLSGIWGFTPENGVKDSIIVPSGGWRKQGFDRLTFFEVVEGKNFRPEFNNEEKKFF